MELKILVDASAQVAATRKRNEKIRHIAECLVALGANELEPAVFMLSGSVRQGKIGVGYSVLKRLGPIEAAVEPVLSIEDVDAALDTMRAASGPGSGTRRQALLRGLMSSATADEQQFIAQILVGELRQGALESLVVDAIAKAYGLPAALVRRAQMLSGNLGAVALTALHDGEPGLRRIDLQLLRPVQPMLAHTAESMSDAFARFQEAAVELKLDGARVQVHKSGAEVRVFSRASNDVTHAVPEIVESMRALPSESIILDGETLVLDADQRPLPFQTTMRRFGRKLDVEGLRQSLPLSTFYFDCLYLDGRSLIDDSAAERWQALASALPRSSHIPRLVTDDEAAASRFLTDAFDAGHEGVMVKNLTSLYEAGGRGAGWLKLKQIHTMDLVVLAAEWGSGRRTQWLSNLHLGARDPETGTFVMLGKTFKGMTDRILAWQTKALLEREIEREGNVVHVKPELVAEIAFNDVQTSPHYPGGVALRFARLKAYRDDKRAEEADTIDAVRALVPNLVTAASDA